MEATGPVFLWSVPQNNPRAFNLTLTGQRAGNRGRCGVMERISHHLAPEGGKGELESLCSLFLLAQSGTHRPMRVASFNTAAESDVHFKLSLIPNCVLPVMIVQVVQVVHFYF